MSCDWATNWNLSSRYWSGSKVNRSKSSTWQNGWYAALFKATFNLENWTGWGPVYLKLFGLTLKQTCWEANVHCMWPYLIWTSISIGFPAVNCFSVNVARTSTKGDMVLVISVVMQVSFASIFSNSSLHNLPASATQSGPMSGSEVGTFF